MPVSPNEKLIDGAKIGNMELVRAALAEKADNYNLALAEAAFRGHADIVKLMLEKGASSLRQAFIKVIASMIEPEKKKVIIRLLSANGLVIETTDLDYLPPNDREEITSELLNYQLEGDIEALACKFSETGKLDNIKKLLDKNGHKEKGQDLKMAEIFAADLDAGLKDDVLNMVRESINDNYFILNSILLAAIESDRLRIVKYAVENGAEASEKAYRFAKEKGYMEIILYLKKIMNKEEK